MGSSSTVCMNGVPVQSIIIVAIAVGGIVREHGIQS
jgi:hypothetical protein